MSVSNIKREKDYVYLYRKGKMKIRIRIVRPVVISKRLLCKEIETLSRHDGVMRRG